MPVVEKQLDIMAVLKGETAHAHQQVERLMPFFAEGLSLKIYAQTLSALLGFFQPMEQKLAAISEWDAVGIDLAKRQRSHLLRADLRALGMAEPEISATPRCAHLPATGNWAAGFGCLYVLEGSTLGGKMIAHEMQRRFGIDQSSGASFFLSYGEDVGEMWRDFCRAVRAYVNTSARASFAVQAATETFQSLEAWIRKANTNGQ